MCLEIKYSIIFAENTFSALKTGQQEKTYIISEIDIPEFNMQLIELIEIQVWCLVSQKYLIGLQMEIQMKMKVQIISHINIILTKIV